MAAFADLSAYEYGPPEGGVTLLNVGWLGSDVEWDRGEVPIEALRSMIRLAAHPHSVMRGLHYCEFCQLESPIRLDTSLSPKGRVSLGTGEIRVAAPGDSVVYCAPTLIVHYVLDHGYLPPEGFLVALASSHSAAAPDEA